MKFRNEANSSGKTLVAGARGFIGRRLLRPGDRALARTASNNPDSVVGDLLDSASLMEACAGVDTIFHCAGYAHAFASSDPDAHWRINFEGTRNLLAAAGAAGVRCFVFLSSVKAMAEPGDECVDEDWPGEPATPYGRAKRAAEDAVLEAGAKIGMHVVNLRLAMVYGRGGRGNLERMARGIRTGWFPPLPETGNRRSLVHVSDVVAAMRLVADAPAANGRTYIVADPQAYSGRQIYDAIYVNTRDAISPVPKWGFPSVTPTLRWSVPVGLLRGGGKVGDALGMLLRRPLPLSSEVVSRLLDSACYSPARIQGELGWRAKIGLAEGVREMLR
ncbi:MAG: NAD-dependent epimerase/dehydratase family protein [Gammaproteobacteria bacterium]|nr:NAD-dependent epimerase/dehydratase family protein [Rhodocyclaceae bacterium]MBU3910510.1 NAD-dependent epimerase/dehydratase family protein [Gammaproteobacteria bacterium]MBU3989588.1 NAD-dependent epimerase/dehydratase family protein [Gammaproteobacteria bacterium]MBU4004991.1 NAD-dependent epimerase/dehydratase family protein [Gammaproteobacteria bacterium]MBU4020584.1 NAD-dependent epimerase/dehydratase family protein [Gammaproteobacteria bacterium]